MLYIQHIINKINKLKPSFERKNLTEEEYRELCKLINEVVREARLLRSSRLGETPTSSGPDDSSPEDFLLELFKRLIEKKVQRFLGKYEKYQKHIRYEIIQNKNSEKIAGVKDTSTFKEWFGYALQITRAIILGDSSARLDRQREIDPFINNKFISSEEKQLTLNYKYIKAHRDSLLGQEGTHKRVNYLDELTRPSALEKAEKLSKEFNVKNIWEGLENIKGGGYLIKDKAAIDASKEIALKFKKKSKENPYYDEPTSYDPDYKPSELRSLIAAQKYYNLALEMWGNNQINESSLRRLDGILTKENFIKEIEKDIGISLNELKRKIRSFPKNEPNLIIYLFGTSKKPGKLFYRLIDFKRFQDSKNKRKKPEENSNFNEKEKSQKEKSQIFEICFDDNEFQDNSGSPEEMLINKEHKSIKNERLNKIMNILTEKQKNIFVLRFIEKLPVVEISKTLKVSRANIYKHIKKIKSSLKAFQ